MVKKEIMILALLPLFLKCSERIENHPVKQEFSVAGKEVLIYTTAQNTDLRLSLIDKKLFEPAQQPLETEVSVFVNPHKIFQTFFGIGGAITDAAAEVFAKLPAEKQDELLKAYYSQNEGIGYTLARTNIHSCDFSSESYTYVSDEDKELKTFSNCS